VKKGDSHVTHLRKINFLSRLAAANLALQVQCHKAPKIRLS
jgi:hypothetical protein